jgi:hypothetical protein
MRPKVVRQLSDWKAQLCDESRRLAMFAEPSWPSAIPDGARFMLFGTMTFRFMSGKPRFLKARMEDVKRTVNHTFH